MVIKMTKDDASYIVSCMEPGMDWVDLAGALSEVYGDMWDGEAEDLYHRAFDIIHPTYTFGVCAARHEMPVKEFIFDEIIRPTDTVGMYNEANKKIPADAEHINLYITGLTPATLAIVNVCYKRGITLTAYNYNRETGRYQPQRVLD